MKVGVQGAHLVGSVPLAGADEVFRTASAILGPWLRRIPDGETGRRLDWIGWQLDVFRASPAVEVLPPDLSHYRPLPRVRLRDGASIDDVQLGPLGYAEAARQSYGRFSALRFAGVVPETVRFQVSLPTPLAPIGAFAVPDHAASLEQLYEEAMLAEVDEICAIVPHEDLAVQWDTAVEFGILEGLFPPWFDDPERGIVERLCRVGGRVPEDVELGYHLCYGDAGHKHFKEPEDAAKLVAVANGVAARLNRWLQWVHLPVPRQCDDRAYFEPLADLVLGREAELYLGLVHRTDGVEGTRRRMAAAAATVDRFGVATECGMGRRPADTIREVMGIHAEVAAPHAR